MQQFNHGKQALELVEAGLMLDLTDVEANNWKEIIFPKSLLDACTVDGRIYCAPVNIHSLVALDFQQGLRRYWYSSSKKLE